MHLVWLGGMHFSIQNVPVQKIHSPKAFVLHFVPLSFEIFGMLICHICVSKSFCENSIEIECDWEIDTACRAYISEPTNFIDLNFWEILREIFNIFTHYTNRYHSFIRKWLWTSLFICVLNWKWPTAQFFGVFVCACVYYDTFSVHFNKIWWQTETRNQTEKFSKTWTNKPNKSNIHIQNTIQEAIKPMKRWK